MIGSQLSQLRKSGRSSRQEERKDKGSLMKKLLVNNKILSILSHQPRKLMKFARKGNLVYKNLQQHSLLPKLTLNNLFPQIEDLNKSNQEHQEQFQEVNKELTCSMINFQHNISKISQEDEGKILNLQTQKCYTHIPPYFFQQLQQQTIQQILTRERKKAQQKTFDLMDYSDEVEYNINQQVGYKMKVFMDFAFFLQGIAGLVDISCKKIKGSRARNNIVKQIIVQKSININILRIKQSNLTDCIKIVDQIKKVKLMQKSLMSLIHAKGKIVIGDFYQTYSKEHDKIKQICCKKNLCNFGDIRYYVQRNYQQTFNKSLQNYLGQMTKIDKLKLFQILKPTKNNYVSTPFGSRNLQFQSFEEKGSFCLDESIEVQDEFQLVVKRNIQEQISNIFQLGIQKCTYATDSLCLHLKEQLQQLQLKVYSVILQNIQRPKEDLIDNFVKYALNRPTQNSLQLKIDDKLLSYTQKAQILNRIPMVKFTQITELLSRRLMNLVVRCFSIVNELMQILRPFQHRQPEKEEVINAYLIQLVIICISFSNSCLGTYITLREVKQADMPLTDKVINCCQEWEQFLEQSQTKYQFLWRKLIFHLSDQPYNTKSKKQTRGSLKQARGSLKQLQQFVNYNYSTKEIQQLNQERNQDVSEQLIDRGEMKLKLLNQIIHAKNQKLCFNFHALTKMVINKDLCRRVENETWTAISMNPNIQKSVGFLIYGQRFLNRQESQNDSKNFLSTSLLLDKSNFGFKRISQEFIPVPIEEQFEIQTTQKYIKLFNRHFKLVGVTQYVLEVIYLFFLYFDRYSFDEQKFNQNRLNKENMPQKSVQPDKIRLSLLIDKTTQVISILTKKIRYFVNNLKDLQKKVKSFAKFMLLVYIQLDFFRTTISILTKQKKRFQQSCFLRNTQKQIVQTNKAFMKQIDQCMGQIVKKYNSIGYQKIKQAIRKMQINPKKQIKIPSDTTSQILTYFSKSLNIIEEIIIDKRQFWKFLNCPWIKIYLQKMNQQSTQIRKFVLKSNDSNSGRRIEQIEWEDKLDWKQKQLRWLLSAIQNQNYSQHIKDLYILQDQLKKIKRNQAQKK